MSSSQTLDPNALAYDLTPAQQGAFCEWEVSLFGGWDGGDIVSCGDAGQVPGHFGPPNQTACVGNLAQSSANRQGCTATVGVVQMCFQVDVQNLCPDASVSLPAVCAVLQTPACAAQ